MNILIYRVPKVIFLVFKSKNISEDGRVSELKGSGLNPLEIYGGDKTK